MLDPAPEQAAHWRTIWRAGIELRPRLGKLTLVVEDAAPDAVFAFLLWLAYVNGVEPEEFRSPVITKWIEAVQRWEMTGLVNNPYSSWAALLSVLSYSYFAPQTLEFDGVYDF
ncbi:MAG: hypothetical protein ACRERU_17425 [Methylococcales bacterium]